MKIYIPTSLSTVFVFLMLTGSLQAQDTSMKKLPDVTVTSTTNVSKKVADIFKATFPDAENAVWSKLNKDYLVDFITRDLKNRVLFQRNGSIVYHIKYGHEKNLPEEVRKLIKSTYSYVDLNITNAINVQEDKRNIWVVNLEDNKKIVVVRVEEGEMEEVSSFNKTT